MSTRSKETPLKYQPASTEGRRKRGECCGANQWVSRRSGDISMSMGAGRPSAVSMGGGDVGTWPVCPMDTGSGPLQSISHGSFMRLCWPNTDPFTSTWHPLVFFWRLPENTTWQLLLATEETLLSLAIFEFPYSNLSNFLSGLSLALSLPCLCSVSVLLVNPFPFSLLSVSNMPALHLAQLSS